MSFLYAEGRGWLCRLSAICILMTGLLMFGCISNVQASSFKERAASMGAVKGIRTSTTADKTRVVIDLSKEIAYETVELSNPDRVVVDMHGTWIAPDVPRSITVNDRFVKAIRIAQHDADTVRMVVETNVGRNNYDIFDLANGNIPYRIVIDVGNTSKSTSGSTIDFSAGSSANQDGYIRQDTQAPEESEIDPAAQRGDITSDEPRTVRQDTVAPEDSADDGSSAAVAPPAVNSDDGTGGVAPPAANGDEGTVDNPAAAGPTRGDVAVAGTQNENIDTGSDKKDTEVATESKVIVEPVYEPGVRGKTIVIDPGHGGSDVGAIGPTGVTEKSVTLRIALQVQKLLQESGANVIMTRDTDIEVSDKRENASDVEELQARCDIANKAKADIFISIHMDSFTNSTPSGTTGYYYVNGSKTGTKLSAAVSEGIMKQLNTSYRGNKSCNFYVVKHTNMPATLVEVAFISNRNEEKLMNSDVGIKKAANGIVKGIGEFFG